MKKNYVFVIFFLALTAFSGCNNNNSGEKGDNIIKSNIKNEPIKIHTQKENDEKKTLNKIGITTTDDGKIIIEPKKTKEFFKKIANTLKKEAKRIKDNNKDINANDIGISSNKEKIVIDVNKTEKFFDKLSKDILKSAEELEKVFDK